MKLHLFQFHFPMLKGCTNSCFTFSGIKEIHVYSVSESDSPIKKFDAATLKMVKKIKCGHIEFS